jgi:hypothetical protein
LANTYTLIEAQTLSSAVSSVTLGSGGTIPQTYTDLLVKVSGRTNRADTADDLYITFNGINSGYSTRNLQGDGTSATSDTFAGITTKIGRMTQDAGNNTSNTFGSADIYIPNYASSNAKSISIDNVQEQNGTAAYSNMIAGLWSYSGQPAITSITFTPVGSFVQYSTFYLYGIKNS